MDLLSNAENLAQDLEKKNTSGHGEQRKCVRLVANIRAFVAAHSNMLAILREPKLVQRQTCSQMVDCMIEDMENVVGELILKLEESERRNSRARRRLRSLFIHEETYHPIALFFTSSRTMAVRRAQIVYATTVAELVHFAALHAISDGYRSLHVEDQREARSQQFAKISEEWAARCDLQTKTTKTNDDFVKYRLWLRDYRYGRDLLPLTHAASVWFEQVVFDNTNLAQQFRVLRRQQRETQAQVTRLDGDLIETRAEVARLEAELEASNQRYAELEGRYHSLQNQYNEEARQWEGEMQELEQENARLENEMEQLEQENAMLKQELDGYLNRRGRHRSSSSRHPSRHSSRRP